MTIEVENAGTEIRSNQSVFGSSVFRGYLVFLLILAVLLYAAPLVLIRIPGFERWAGSNYGPMLDFGFRTAGKNADVVIFGDSSALYGIDPVQMSAALGVKVINLPNSGGSLPAIGDMALRRYLSSNVAPKLIVFYFSPWDLNYSHETKNPYIFEGEEMLLRYGTFSEIAGFSRKYPSSPLLFPFQYYKVSFLPAVSADLRRQNRGARIASRMGHVEFPMNEFERGRDRVMNDSCVIPSSLTGASQSDSAAELIHTFKTPETSTLFYVAPVPGCRNAAVFASHSYADLSALPPVVLPANLYAADKSYIHLSPAGVPFATRNLVDAVRSSLASTHLVKPQGTGPGM